jgi:hypothetical protein
VFVKVATSGNMPNNFMATQIGFNGTGAATMAGATLVQQKITIHLSSDIPLVRNFAAV